MTVGDLLEIPGGIHHWRDIFATLAWAPAKHFYEDLGVPSDAAGAFALHADSAREAVDGSLAATDGRTLSPEEYREVQEASLESALQAFTPSERESVVRLGAYEEDRAARAFAWSTVVPRLLAVENSPFSAVAVELLQQWAAEERNRRNTLRQLVSDVEHLTADDDERESNLAELVRQAGFRRLWTALNTLAAADRAALIAAAQSQADLLDMPVDLAG